MPHRVAFLVIATLFTFASMGCSPNMESTGSTPVDVDEYQIGQNRDSVLERLGAPESTATENAGVSCDRYKLSTKESGVEEKIPPAASEAAPDAATWLADNLSKTTERASKNGKHLVAFCYKDGRIVRIDRNTGASAASAPSGTTPSAAAAPLTQVSPGQSSAAVAISKSSDGDAIEALKDRLKKVQRISDVAACSRRSTPRTRSRRPD